MSTLILFAAAAPFRAAVQLGDGARTLLRGVDAPGDDSTLDPFVFVDELGIDLGNRARFLHRSGAAGNIWYARADGLAEAEVPDPAGGAAWLGRDIFAVIVRRFIQTAERNLGIDIFRLVLVVPPDLSSNDRAALVEAGHLAGCALVELKDVTEVLAAAHDSEVGKRHLLIQHDADQLRVTAFRCAASGARIEVCRDLSDDWSGERLVERFVSKLSADEQPDSRIHDFLARELPRWTAHDAGETLVAGDYGPPQPLYLPASARTILAEEIIEQVKAAR